MQRGQMNEPLLKLINQNVRTKLEVRGDLMIVTQPSTQFFAVYIRPTNQPQLILKRRTDTDDHVLLAQVSQAANAKARELGWIA